MLIDAHCHLDFHSFLDSSTELPAVMERAFLEGVGAMINAGDDLESSFRGLELAYNYDQIFCTFGVHPNWAKTWSPQVEAAFVEAMGRDCLLERHRIIGMGEMGLDYFHMKAPKDLQQAVFRQQLRLAKRENLPVVVHCREAFEDVFQILEEESAQRVMFHCFDGNVSMAAQVWERGWVTSFTATVSYPKSDVLREVVRACPAELYFLETDAPFLSHQTIRGQRNEPAFLVKLAKTFAELREVSFERIAEESTQNVVRFFELPLLRALK